MVFSYIFYNFVLQKIILLFLNYQKLYFVIFLRKKNYRNVRILIYINRLNIILKFTLRLWRNSFDSRLLNNLDVLEVYALTHGLFLH